MSEFRTIVSIPPGKFRFTLKERFLTAGSCFSDAIGTRLSQHKIKTVINPFGTLYSPWAVHRVLEYATDKKYPPEETYLKNGDIFLNYDLHSSFSSLKSAELHSRIEQVIDHAHQELKTTGVLLLTYGTAWTWLRKDTGDAVANCHKMPVAAFDKKLLAIPAITDSFTRVYTRLKEANKHLKIILTVSPVRHVRDTLPLNQVSKSILRVACHELAAKFDDVEYFPAYEIMVDDLRDYRFYKPDMIHPTEQAEEYIWGRFIAHYYDNDARSFIQKWKNIQSAMRHKPFREDSAGHKFFLKDILQKLMELESIVNVDEEIDLIRTKLDPHNKNIDA